MKNKLFNILIILIFTTSSALAEEVLIRNDETTEVEKENQVRRGMDGNSTATNVNTYEAPTNSDNVKEMKMKDWQNIFKAGGTGTGAASKTQMFFGGSAGADSAFSGNPNMMTKQKIKDNNNSEVSLKVWSSELDEKIKNESLNNNTNKVVANGSIICHLSRDIPVSYKCNLPTGTSGLPPCTEFNEGIDCIGVNAQTSGLTYGGSFKEKSAKTLQRCENECYLEESCKEVKEETGTGIFEISEDIYLSTTEPESPTNEYKKTSTISGLEQIYKLTTITFELKVTKVEDENASKESTTPIKVYMNYEYTNRNDALVKKLTSYRLDTDRERQTITINDYIRSGSLEIYTQQEDLEIEAVNILYSYRYDGRYICKTQQDISEVDPGAYAKLCPSGNIVTVNSYGREYKICADYGVRGNNSDGTFSTKSSCQATCKKNFKCTVKMQNVTIESLKAYREGCIEGQAECRENTCKNLRISEAPIVNENIFDAGQVPLKTVINGTIVDGVDRPKPEIDQDKDFDTVVSEEFKKKAWDNMVDNNKYRVSKVKLREDTESENAYHIGNIANLEPGKEGSYKKPLYWIHKPRALEVNTEQSFKFYMVLEAVVQNNKIKADGTSYISRDKIYYVKTGINDNFVPIARRENFTLNTIVIDDNGLEKSVVSENKTSSLKYETFDSSLSGWYARNSSLTLPYFKQEQMKLQEPTKRRTLVQNLHRIYYTLPGIIRSKITDGPYTTNIYSGGYNGTGDILAQYIVYVYYENASKKITYSDIVNKIKNKEIVPIYDNLSSSSYATTVKGDAEGDLDDNIKLNVYGPVDKKTGFLSIKISPNDVGKYGYIFVKVIE